MIVKLDNKTIEVKKLPIGDYAELLKAIKKLPQHLQTFENLDTEKIIGNLPEILGECLPDFLRIIAIAVKHPYEEVRNLGADEIVKLIKAIFEVNNYLEIYKIIKKALAHPALKKVQKEYIKKQ